MFLLSTRRKQKKIKNMTTINEIQLYLEKELESRVSYTEIGYALKTGRANISKRAKNESELTEAEIKKIESFFGKSVNKVNNSNDDCITLEHIHINPSCGTGTVVMDTADVTPIKIGREIIKSLWNAKPEDLKIFKASGDSMQECIYSDDLLLIDLSKTDYNNGGIFLLTINNDWFIKRLRLRVTGELDIISDNSKYPIETLKPDTKVEIKVIGKVIKNLSRGL